MSCLAYSWFQSYLSNRKQFVSINGFESSTLSIKHGVPQGSVLGPLLFLIYIIDLNNAIRYSTAYHFADDTNLLNINSSAKRIQKQVNIDLKLLYKWLLANKISLNCAKTEMIIFRKPKETINHTFKIYLNGHRLTLSPHIKYLGIYLDEHLNGVYQTSLVMKKLSRANGMLAKVRHFVQVKELRSIYFSIFESHLNYGIQVWLPTNNKELQDKIFKLQKNALRIMSFSGYLAHTSPLFNFFDIVKLPHKLGIKDCLLALDFLKGDVPCALDTLFSRCIDIHSCDTRNAASNSLWVPHVDSTTYGSNSITFRSILIWNTIAPFTHPQLLTRSILCKILSSSIINKY